MRITRKLAAQARKAIIAKIGETRQCKVGLRVQHRLDADPRYDFNTRPEAAQGAHENPWDLCETVKLHELGSEEIAEVDGFVEIDVYCYYPTGHQWEHSLDQNVSVFFRNGELIEVLTTEELMVRPHGILCDMDDQCDCRD